MEKRFCFILLFTVLLGCNAGAPTDAAKTVSTPSKKEEPKGLPADEKNIPQNNLQGTPLQPSPPDGGLKVMTTEDMDRLRQERQGTINRTSPLGEEKDPVEALRKQTSGK